MSRHKEGNNREQASPEPLCFDGLIDEENPIRAVDAIVNRFDLVKLSFAYSETKDTGRKPYSPSDMLKPYLYGYFNGIRSLRKLERERSSNVGLMRLIGCLKPDFKTIADFRENNQETIQRYKQTPCTGHIRPYLQQFLPIPKYHCNNPLNSTPSFFTIQLTELRKFCQMH